MGGGGRVKVHHPGPAIVLFRSAELKFDRTGFSLIPIVYWCHHGVPGRYRGTDPLDGDSEDVRRSPAILGPRGIHPF